MADIPSVDDLVGQMITGATDILNTDLQNIQGFSRTQLTQIGEQAKWIAEADAAGTFDDDPDLRDHFLKGLDELMRLTLRVLQGVLLVTIEKIWNAWVKILWAALDKAAGFPLPRPGF